MTGGVLYRYPPQLYSTTTDSEELFQCVGPPLISEVTWKDYGGEWLLDETVDNLATERKNTQMNLGRTLTNLKPHPSAKFSLAYGPGDVPPGFSTLPCQANSRVTLQQRFY